MSVKFSNNTIKKLGTDLPTLYLERVELYDDTFRIKLALYVDGNADEQDIYDSYVSNTLSSLKYYIMLVMDGPVSPQWAPKNLPPPSVELISTTEFDNTFGLMELVEHYNIINTLTGHGLTDLGLEPSTSTGNAITYVPDTPGTTYASVAQNFYTSDEAGQASTDRIKKLISGEKTAFELVRRSGDYQIMGVDATTAAEYFDLETTSKMLDTIPYMTTKILYRNPTDHSLTDSDGNYPAPVVWGAGTSLTTFEWSDPNLNNDPIGLKCPYPPNNGTGGNTIKLTMADFGENYEIIYKPDGNVVYKHSITIEDAFAGSAVEHEADSKPFFGGSFSDWRREVLNLIPKVSIIAFSSILDIDIGPSAGDTSYLTTGHVTISDPVDIARAKLPIAKLNALMTSDITYETITEYGKVIDKSVIIYVDSAGEEYEGTPIQATDSLYHEESDISLEQVRQAFEDFSKSASGPLDRSDPIAQSGLDDLENALLFILNEYGDKPSLLVKLNEFRKSFPDTSSASATGKLYQQLKKKLFEINRKVIQSPVLMKRLARTAVVVDYRHTIFKAWKQPTHADPYEYRGLYIPPTNADYVNCVIPQVSKFGDQYSPYVGSGTDGRALATKDKINIFINGFYFFDYEKAIQRTSGLSKLLNVDKFESFFGRRVTQSKFQLHLNEIGQSTLSTSEDDFYSYVESDGDFYRVEAEVSDIGIPSTAYHSYDAIPTTSTPESVSSDSKADITATYSQTAQYPLVTESQFHSSVSGDEHGYNEGYARSYVDVVNDDQARHTNENEKLGISPGRAYSYTALRNFEFLDNLKFGPNPYRLMAFEFQFVVPAQSIRADYDPTYQDYLTYRVVVTDNTTSIFGDLRTNYSTAQRSVFLYATAAQEFCSYNNLDGFFNDFFANYQTNLYSATPQLAPWILGPLVYNIHLDLLTNEHNGDKLKVLDASLKIIEKINPETGTLPEVLSFYIQYQDLWDTYYDKNNVNSAAYEYNEMQSSALYNGPYNIKYGGNDGTSSPAGTYYPLPELHEVFYSTLTDSDFTATDYAMHNKMVKMNFGMINVPSMYLDDIGLPMTPQILISQGTVSREKNGEKMIWFDAKTKNMTHDLWMPEPVYTGDVKSYQLASYCQQAVSGDHLNTVEMSIPGDVGSKQYDLQRVVVTENVTVLQNKNWIRQGQWDSPTGTTPNRAAISPQYVSMYLFAGVTYTLTFMMAKRQSFTSDGTADYASAPNLWRSNSFTITVPDNPAAQTIARVDVPDGGIWIDQTNFYLDCNELGVDNTTGAVNGSSGKYDLYSSCDPGAWVSNPTVLEKMLFNEFGATSEMGGQSLPLLRGFPSHPTDLPGQSDDSWPNPPTEDEYASRHPESDTIE
tara:strand:+ start:1560 stop:5648 length:4089 start_codon:yes stop_codon:yes gene_type:complete